MSIAAYATGLQHIGIPTADIDATTEFYISLGFETVHRNHTGSGRVVFLRLKDLVVETWEGAPTGKPGAIDHFAIDVTDIEAVFRVVTEAGLTVIENGIQQLPFWERGVRYFTVMGLNAEKIEFAQIL